MRIIHLVMAMMVTFPANAGEFTLKNKEKYIAGCKFALQSMREKGCMVRESTEILVCTLEMQSFDGKVVKP